MGRNFTFLIDKLKNVQDKKLPLEIEEFADCVREGMITEPEKFAEFANTYQEMINRERPDLLAKQRNYYYLDNLAGFVVKSDIEDDDVRNILKYLADVSSYGPAMRAFADYLGIEGQQLIKYITKEDFFSN